LYFTVKQLADPLRSMRKVIQQSVVLPASAESLFEMYLDPTTHGAITGSAVTIGAEPGAAFRAFDGQLSGAILAVVRPHLIVQSWRSTKFHSADADSTLILLFTPDDAERAHGRIDLVHLDVPDHDYQDVTEGWPKYYWTPWQNCLERR
jgi:activator of HSP90 ATPase